MENQSLEELDEHDQLPIMEVGDWSVDEKHRILERYIDISHAVRAKFRTRTYIDLFSGPGKIKTKDDKRVGHGSPLAALHISKARKGEFTEFYIADANRSFVQACTSRFEAQGILPITRVGMAHETVDFFRNRLSSGALHLAILDPFNLSHLHFSIIKKLSSLKFIDIVVHFSTGDLQRNIGAQLNQPISTFDDVAPGWREHVSAKMSKIEMQRNFIEHWMGLVRDTGLGVSETQYVVKNSKRSAMYRLVLLARHERAHEFWGKACGIDVNHSLF